MLYPRYGKSEKTKIQAEKVRQRSVLEMANASDFLNAVEALYRSNICCRKSSAYEMSGNYYLVFDYFSLPKHMIRVLSEYGERQKHRNAAARVRENANLLCHTDAVAVIGKFLV